MDTTRVTAREFREAFGTLSEQAKRVPVVITEEGHDALVVMSAEEWERLRRRDRRAGLTSELSDEWLDAVREAKVPEEFEELGAELK